MQKILFILFLILAGCTNSSTDAPKDFPKSPGSYDEIPEITYDSLSETIMITELTSQNAFTEVSLGGVDLNTQVKITSQNTTGEVFSIKAPVGVTVSQNCVKAYILDESCLVNILVSSSYSQSSFILRAATSKGLKFFIFKVKRTVQTGVADISVNNNGSINFGLAIGKQSIQKNILIKNTGSVDLSNVDIKIKGKDQKAFKVMINSCQNRTLKPKDSCSVRLLITAAKSSNGNYEAKILVNSPNLTIEETQNIVAQIDQSTVSPTAPQISGLDSLKVSAENTLNILPMVTGGDPLTFSLAPNSLNLQANESTGAIQFIPTLAQQGLHTLTLYVSNGKSPAAPVTFNVEVFPKITSAGNLFIEGEVLSPVMSLIIQGNREVQSISSNINDYFTIVQIAGSGVTGKETHLLNQNQVPVTTSIASNNITYDFAGAVKFSGTYQVNFNLVFKDSSTFTFSKTVQINSANLPYVKYDVFAVKSANGYHANSMYASIRELKREYTGWRTPILMRFKNENLICGGTALTSFQAADDTQQECLKNNSSADAETGFFFYDVYSNASLIGGIANGTRASFVVQAIPYTHTLAHELGHQLGLWHTFETAWNDVLVHCDSSNLASCFTRPLYYDNLSQGYDIFGDWAFYKVDYNATEGISSYSFSGITEDTPFDFFNGKVVTLNNQYCIPPFFQVYCNSGYPNGTSALIWYGGQSWTTSSGGHACSQSVGANSPYPAPVTCNNIPGLGTITLQENAVKNTMSYWYHTTDSARFTQGQKNRMNRVLQDYPELTTP